MFLSGLNNNLFDFWITDLLCPNTPGTLGVSRQQSSCVLEGLSELVAWCCVRK